MDPTQESEIEVGSDRSFGLVFTAVFVLIGIYPLLAGEAVRWVSVAIGAVFFACAIVYPAVLGPLNLLWFKFGMLLGRIVNPLVMFVIFVVTIVPIALIFRVLRKDPLRLRFAPDQKSYWIERTPPGPEPATLEEVF